MHSLQLETAFDFSDLQQLASEWRQLFFAVHSASPFQSPEWLLAWWKYFRPGELRCVALRDSDDLVGLFPFYVEHKESGQRELKLIGSGNSDYLEPLIRPDYEQSACERLAEWLSENSDQFDKCVFEGLTENSSLSAALPEQTGWVDSEPCLCRPLPRTRTEWRKSISPKLNDNIRYCWHRAERSGPLRLQHAIAANVDEYVRIFALLHRCRWSAQGSRDALAGRTVEAFYREVSHGLATNGILRLAVLWWADTPVAAVYGFAHQQTFYIYLTDFDPRFARFSVGKLAINAAIEAAIDEGCSAVDFLRGREAYKYRFGATEKQMGTLCCPATALRLHIELPA